MVGKFFQLLPGFMICAWLTLIPLLECQTIRASKSGAVFVLCLTL